MNDEGCQAFAPGHVTGFFTVERADDPMETGSRGAGITIDDGVTVTVQQAEERSVYLDDVSVEIDAVEAVLDALRASVEVRVRTPLPLGAGFGVSGASALATALATNVALDRGLSTDECVALAHGAEVQAGTGLGDVVAQARGGVPIRLEPGAPRYNQLDAIPVASRPVEYLTLGELDTATVIGDETERLTAAGRRGLSAIVDEPTLARYMQASRQFSREADLIPAQVYDVVTDVSEADGSAAMGMLGQTVVALGTGLTDAGYDPVVCQVDPAGARMLDPPTAGSSN